MVNALAVAGAAVGGLSLVLTMFAQFRLRKLRRSLTELRGGGRAAAHHPHAELGALRRVAVVRYDAFGDMGGRLSFSAALLDDAGDGLVLTSINGRTETRTYAKGISAGRGEQMLSPEEKEAISAAMQGTRVGSLGSRR
jgi:Protein of unknown function (DUF4446)